jgi:methionyl-tRNA formyltransferase
MRIVFAGSGSFGLPSLRALVDGGQDVVMILTQPDRPAGRGRLVRIGPVKRFARDNGIPLLQTENVNTASAVRRVRGVRPDLLLVIAFGQKIGPKLIEMPTHGAVNLHGSLLPKYRGPAPINWAVINGETETGLTVIAMTDQIDAGDILGQRAAPIGPNETAGQLHDRLAELGARLVTEVVREIPLDEVERRRQNDNQATVAPRLTKADGRINWNRPARDVHNHIRGMTPWPGALAHLTTPGRKKTRLRLTIDRAVVSPVPAAGAAPGTIVDAAADGIEVAAARGTVRILELTPAGKRTMTAADAVNGYAIKPGLRFAAVQEKASARHR